MLDIEPIGIVATLLPNGPVLVAGRGMGSGALSSVEPTTRPAAGPEVTLGFVVSYPTGASDATCYDAEPWHVRWVGRDRAAAVQASGLTLREWLWGHPAG